MKRRTFWLNGADSEEIDAWMDRYECASPSVALRQMVALALTREEQVFELMRKVLEQKILELDQKVVGLQLALDAQNVELKMLMEDVRDGDPARRTN